MAKKLKWNNSEEVITKYAVKDSHGNDIDVADLQSQIDGLKNIGRFLSLWNASTGVAVSNPPSSPYTYKTGDYFRVSVAGNRVPAGSSYTIGGTNYNTIQTTLPVGAIVYFDGTYWQLEPSGSGGNVIDVRANGVSVVNAGVANITPTNLGMGDVVDYSNENPTTVAVGGIAKGTTFTSKSVVEILEAMLYPYVAFSNFNVSMVSQYGEYEYGSVVTFSKFTPTFTKGSVAPTSLKVGTSSGGSNLYNGVNPTSGNQITLTTSDTWNSTTSATKSYYFTLYDGTTTKTIAKTYTRVFSGYYKAVSSTTIPVSSLVRDRDQRDENNNIENIETGVTVTYSAGNYLYFYSHDEIQNAKIQAETFGGWGDSDLGTTSLGSKTITNSAGVTISYYVYRTTNPCVGSGTGKFRIV